MYIESNGIPREVFKPLWEYTGLSDYIVPGAPARETMRKGFIQFWERLRNNSPSQFERLQALRSLPSHVLNWAAPPPSSTQGMLGLQFALDSWLQTSYPQRPVRVVVGPPGSGAEQVVRDIGRHMGWRIVRPPSEEEILAGGKAWLEDLINGGDDPFVVPQLGKWYLRHHEGLDLMNRVLDWLEMTHRRCLIACDSWAWAFLVKAMQIDAMLPEPLALAPFHAERLQFWLPLLARRTYKGAFIFRYVSDGQLVFPIVNREELEATRHPAANQRDKYADWLAGDYFMKQLAAYSRGIPGVAWTYWRRCLQIAEEGNIDADVMRRADVDAGYTVWVSSWSQLRLPFVPTWASTPELFILHALLLHGGLSAVLLAEVLPFSDNEVRQIMYRLRNAGLVSSVNRTWHVSLLAYPTVRHFLSSEGYLVDDF